MFSMRQDHLKIKNANDLNVEKCFELSTDENTELLEKFIASHPFVLSARNSQGQTVLSLATSHGNLTSIRNLIAAGAHVNQTDEQGRTPLYIASIQGWHEGVLFLLKHLADPLLPDRKMRLPLHVSTYNEKVECLAELIQESAPDLVNSGDEEKMTALHWAAYHGRPNHLKLLLSRGALISAADCESRTPLHWACQMGSAACAEIIINQETADKVINARDGFGKGPLHYAAAAGHSEVISILSRSKHLNVHMDDPNDRQPLHWAASLGRTKCVKMLLELGADPTVCDVNARNAMHYAHISGHKECAKILTDALKEMRSEQNKGVITPVPKQESELLDSQSEKPDQSPGDSYTEGDGVYIESCVQPGSATAQLMEEDKPMDIKPKRLPPLRGLNHKHPKKKDSAQIENTDVMKDEVILNNLLMKSKVAGIRLQAIKPLYDDGFDVQEVQSETPN